MDKIIETTIKPYSFRLDIALMDRVRQKAEAEEISVTQLVRKYLQEGVEKSVEEATYSSDNSRKIGILQAIAQIVSSPEAEEDKIRSLESREEFKGELKTILDKICHLEMKVDERVNALESQIEQLANINHQKNEKRHDSKRTISNHR
jgi:hypothetical protein